MTADAGMTQPAGRVSSMDHLLNAPASAIGSEPSPDIAAPWPIAAVAAERAAAHSLAATSQLSDAAPVNGPSPRTPQVGVDLLALPPPFPVLPCRQGEYAQILLCQEGSCKYRKDESADVFLTSWNSDMIFIAWDSQTTCPPGIQI